MKMFNSIQLPDQTLVAAIDGAFPERRKNAFVRKSRRIRDGRVSSQTVEADN